MSSPVDKHGTKRPASPTQVSKDIQVREMQTLHIIAPLASWLTVLLLPLMIFV